MRTFTVTVLIFMFFAPIASVYAIGNKAIVPATVQFNAPLTTKVTLINIKQEKCKCKENKSVHCNSSTVILQNQSASSIFDSSKQRGLSHLSDTLRYGHSPDITLPPPKLLS